MTEFRYDRSSIIMPPKAERTREGFLRVYMRLAKTGDLHYRDKSGNTRIEHVTPDVLFNEDSMDSFATKPVTLNHPPVRVTPENASLYSKGLTGHFPVVDGDFLGYAVTITHRDCIDALLSGKMREASAGYDVEASELREDGKFYQLSRIGNHASVCSRGRAKGAGFHIDSDFDLYWQVDELDDRYWSPSDTAIDVLRDLQPKWLWTMDTARSQGIASETKEGLPQVTVYKFNLDGIDFETESLDLKKHAKSVDAELQKLRSDADSAAKLRADSESAHSAVSAKLAEAQTKLDAAEAANETLKSEKSEIQGKLDAAETKANELQAKLDASPKAEERTDAAEIASAVSSRLNLWTEVLPYLRSDSADYQPDYNLDETDIRKLSLSKRRPDMNFDDKDATYIKAFYEALRPELQKDQKDTASNVDGFLAGLNAYRASNEDAMSYEEKKKAAREAQRKAIENGGRK